MEFVLIRHSLTPGNLEKQYVGSTDQPLAPEGEALARERRERMPEVDPTRDASVSREELQTLYISTAEPLNEEQQILYNSTVKMLLKTSSHASR